MKNSHVYKSGNDAATEEFAENLGRQLKGGEVIELIGDVGAGKTTFVRGLARGIGSTDKVTSPTFTVSRVYYSPRLTLRHYDFYRLSDFQMIKNELAEAAGDPKGVIVLEWAEGVRGTLPHARLTILFKVAGDNERELHCQLPETYKHLRLYHDTDN